MHTPDRVRRAWYRRPSRLIPLGVLVVFAVVAVASLLSPWPPALLIRALFEKGARDTVAEMRAYEPDSGVVGTLDVPYGDAGYPDDHEPALPHEYQFHLDFDDARTAFDSTVAFLERTTQ